MNMKTGKRKEVFAFPFPILNRRLVVQKAKEKTKRTAGLDKSWSRKGKRSRGKQIRIEGEERKMMLDILPRIRMPDREAPSDGTREDVHKLGHRCSNLNNPKDRYGRDLAGSWYKLEHLRTNLNTAETYVEGRTPDSLRRRRASGKEFTTQPYEELARRLQLLKRKEKGI